MSAGTPGRRSVLARLRALDAGFFAYFVTRVLASIAGFFVLRFLVAFMSRPQYGEWGYLQAVGEMVVPVVTLSLPAAMMRMYFDRREDDVAGQAALTTTVFLLLAGSATLIALGAGLWWLATGDVATGLFFAALTSAAPMIGFFNYLARARNDYVVFSASRLTTSVGVLGVMALAVELATRDPRGAFAADTRLPWTIGIYALCMWAVVAANTVFYVREGMLRARSPKLPWAEIKALVRFSAPLSGTFFLGWMLNTSDVWLLRRLSGLTEVADYVLAVGIARFTALVTSAALTDWPRFYYAEMRDDRPDRDARIARRVRLFLGLHIGAILLIRLVAGVGYDLLGARAYSAGLDYIGLLALGNFFFLLGNIAAAGIGYAKRTHLTIVTFAIPAVINAGLNILLLPRYGAWAAAVTTAIAFAVFAVLSFAIGRPMYRFTQVPSLAGMAALATLVALFPV